MMVKMLTGLITQEDITQLSHEEGLCFDNGRRAILESMKSIDVQACPGSGKTTLIAAKLILLAKKWPLSGQGICVLSHTNVAKDEIIERLKRSKTTEAQRLLSYPHFIGTIQEFTNRFLAIPYIHSKNINEVTVDNIQYVESAFNLLNNPMFSWLQGTLNGFGGTDKIAAFLAVTYRLSTGAVNISKQPRAWSKPSNLEKAKRLLGMLKDYLDQRGVYLYRDMYSQAHKVCIQNSTLNKTLSMRFPLVFLDEMQDTQRFQDELLCQIFPLEDPNSIVQRFGDPDQAIFQGIESEESNVSFNTKKASEMDFVINKSHRFNNSLADKIKSLSVNQIDLSTDIPTKNLNERLNVCTQQEGFRHSVIIFDDSTIHNVIKSFGDIVSQQFQEEYIAKNNFTVKALGAVGKEIDSEDASQLRIGHYCLDYNNKKAKNPLNSDSFIEIVRYCHQKSTLDFSKGYKLLVDGIIKWLNILEKKDNNNRKFNSKTLRNHLQEKGKWDEFRSVIYSLLSYNSIITQPFWNINCAQIKAIFEVQGNTTAQQYLNYFDNLPSDEDNDPLISLPDNRIKHPAGFEIHLSTIHGVKGETHDATLIMETKQHCFDLESMMDYIIKILPSQDHPQNKLPDKPHYARGFKPNKLFMRQLYVAASRPKHLLCLAMHKSRIKDIQQQALKDLDWNILQLS
ncbi:MAG: UvrD-helicase domain-containing protein [Leadbetterella sp.]|nr:UvrD-helicase domain-containing protein [Leadbetterella sp.]